MTVQVTRLPIRLVPDPTRVITRLFLPGEENRIRGITKRLCSIPPAAVEKILARLEGSFQPLHPDIDEVFRKHFEVVRPFLPDEIQPDALLRRLIGACFTMEYAIESAALFNPGMVSAIDQAGVPAGSLRFVMSLRATGEGHISSIVFRSGVIDAEGRVSVDPPAQHSRTLGAIEPETFVKTFFMRDLHALGASSEFTDATTALLSEQFTKAQLSDAIDDVRSRSTASGRIEESVEALLSLTRANYRLDVPPSTDISEIVIFPFTENERHGVEDMRPVRFTNEDGSHQYFGTYTAYNGFRIFPQLLSYCPGGFFEVHMLSGRCAKNKGMALFPRKIHDKYAMVARLDNENLYYMESDNVLVWERAELLQTPTFPWEVVQIGNCGSPLDTDAGWLLLTHGVGPMRQYCIGATLLDRENPLRIIGQTREPLLVPTGNERFGYVPNVVYSCGGMIHGKYLVLPYAMSDTATSIALVNLNDLLQCLR
jgi:predicted GH43/DUF377 family glycosyl hydrolase